MPTGMHITRATAILNSITINKLSVLAEDGHKYHINSYSNSEDVRLRIASHLLIERILHYWKLNSKYLAGIHLHSDLIKKFRPAFNERDIYTGYRCEEGYVWMSQLLDDGHYWSFKAFEKPDHFLKIGLLDLWVLNQSRSISNPGLILSPTKNGKLKVIPVDYDGLLSRLIKLKWNRNKPFTDITSILDYKLVKKAFYHLNKKMTKKEWIKYFQQSIDETRENYSKIVQSINDEVKLDKTLWNQAYIFLFDSNRNERVFNHFWNQLKR